MAFGFWLRVWWNWQTRYFEVVVGKPVQVQVLLRALTLRQPLVPIQFSRYGDESGPKPLPNSPHLPIEGWPVATGTQSLTLPRWQMGAASYSVPRNRACPGPSVCAVGRGISCAPPSLISRNHVRRVRSGRRRVVQYRAVHGALWFAGLATNPRRPINRRFLPSGPR
jgi:hypothetical protein